MSPLTPEEAKQIFNDKLSKYQKTYDNYCRWENAACDCNVTIYYHRRQCDRCLWMKELKISLKYLLGEDIS
jgi:hypothetical protein